MSRTRSSFARLVLACVFVASPIVAAAQPAPDEAPAPSGQSFALAAASAWSPGTPVPAESAPTALAIRPIAPKRPAALSTLYVSYAALQALDAASTFKALENGAVEANPLLKNVASNRGAMLAVKAGTTAATLYLTERLWKKNRTAAIALMVCANSAYAAIVAHNYRLASARR